MIKKMAAFTLFLIIPLTSGLAVDTIFVAKASYLLPSEQAFRQIYGNELIYGGEVDIGILKNLVLWAGGGYYTNKGNLTFTQEATTLTLVPFGGGVKFRINWGSLQFYAGGGIRYYIYNEKNPIGEAKKNGAGYLGTIGGVIKIRGRWIINIFIDYSYCRMTPADFTINVGGVELGFGIGYEFR
ncbi:MAG: hypothetical protein ACE5LC_05555 [Candidatus Aminicenantales bacterium]